MVPPFVIRHAFGGTTFENNFSLHEITRLAVELLHDYELFVVRYPYNTFHTFPFFTKSTCFA